MVKDIRAVVFDIDGVLTDGRICVSADGTERKTILLTDFDYLNQFIREGYIIAAITGEDTDITDYFESKVEWFCFIRGCKEKGDALVALSNRIGVGLQQICYVGDGLYDIPALKLAGLSVCPFNAVEDAKKVVDICLKSCGGSGCVEELYHLINH